jgi:putative transposase
MDTRNNWLSLMFVCKYRYNCLQKQSIIDDCTLAFKEFENFGFEFKEIGYAGNHVHFQVNVPKKYSVQVAETMLKSRSSKRLFEKHPNLRKRYPRGSFWSGYEHHQSTGLKNLEESAQYIKNQQQHHNFKIIDDRQKNLMIFGAEQDTAT